MDRLLTIDQAADRLGTSPRFVKRLITERRIAFNKLGRHVRLRTSDVDAFIQAGRVEPWSVTNPWSGLQRQSLSRS